MNEEQVQNKISKLKLNSTKHGKIIYFLTGRTNGRAYATVLRLSVAVVVCLFVCTEYIVAKRCVLEKKLLLTAYSVAYKSYMRNRLAQK